MRRFQTLAIATTAATFLLIAVGGLVRATGSGDACPDWPTCFGRWVPPLEYHTLIEYSHRLLATVVGLLGLLLLGETLLHYRRVRQVWVPVVAAAVLFATQAVLGGLVVLHGLNAWLVTAHLATSMLLFGALVHVTANSFCMVKLPLKGASIRGSDPGFARLARISTGATFVLLLVGGYARGEGGVIDGLGWPLIDGRLVPAMEGIVTAHFLHRLAAALVGVLLVILVVRAWTMPKERRSLDLVLFSSIAAGLFVVQAMVGAATVWTGRAPWTVVTHVVLSALIWGSLVTLSTISKRLSGRRPTVSPESNGHAATPKPPLRRTTAAYFQLTKPRIVLLLLITTVPAMVLAAGEVPSPLLVLATLLGGTLAAGGANAINQYYDRDIDEVMRRTRSRPLPAHAIAPETALTFGLLLGGVSFFFLGITVNVLSALLALAALLFYVLIYTVWLKRSTPQNIVIGGAAGAVPVLVGWAAVTGSVQSPAWVMFLIVFLWTPPHFWALSLRHARDYAAANVPMLPVVKGERRTVASILRYSFVLVGSTLLLWPVAHMGAVYVAAAVVLGGLFVARAATLYRTRQPAAAWALFKFSISYLALLFAAVAVDSLAHVPLFAS
jgi:protoheme IX farnesyltransferase